MISVIIPAHNEAAVIARGLTALTSGAAMGELDVVVVCNCCDDDTAAIARDFGHSVRTIETSKKGKSHALNLGDQAARSFPRVYVDADVVCPLSTLRALSDCLREERFLAAAPLPNLDLSRCSWPVRAYYDVRSRLPSSFEGIGGSGVYALSKAGHDRFGSFPDLIADDGFVRVQFLPNERVTLRDVKSTVFAPRDLRDLLAIRTRARYGTVELVRRYPRCIQHIGTGNDKALMRLLRKPSVWPGVAIYIYVNMIARTRAQTALWRGGLAWQRDSTSRTDVV